MRACGGLQRWGAADWQRVVAWLACHGHWSDGNLREVCPLVSCVSILAPGRLCSCCREMQGRRGSGRKLRDLSAEKLGRSIQRSGRRHSPRQAVKPLVLHDSGGSVLGYSHVSASDQAVLSSWTALLCCCVWRLTLLACCPACREDAQAALDLYLQHIHFERR